MRPTLLILLPAIGFLCGGALPPTDDTQAAQTTQKFADSATICVNASNLRELLFGDREVLFDSGNGPDDEPEFDEMQHDACPTR